MLLGDTAWVLGLWTLSLPLPTGLLDCTTTRKTCFFGTDSERPVCLASSGSDSWDPGRLTVATSPVVSSEFLLLGQSLAASLYLKCFLPFSCYPHLWMASCQHSGEECSEMTCVLPVLFLYACRYAGDRKKQVPRPGLKAPFVFPVSVLIASL